MKVLYCILDNRLGGPHRRAYAVSLRLREHGIETLFLTGLKSDDLWRPDGVTVFPLRDIQCLQRHRPLLNLLRFLWRLPRNVAEISHIIRTNDITIVHVDGLMNFVPALAARRIGVPIVWHYNDHLPGPLRRLLEPLAGRLADRMIVQGEGLKLARTRPNSRLRTKTTVLYSAVDTDRLVPEAFDTAERARIRVELGAAPGAVLIGAVGNLNRFKGHTYFLQAAARIAERIDRARFVVVGRELETDAPYGEHLRQLTKQLGLEERVLFTGFRADIPRVLTALDVFVMPSILESCPVALLEAMAMKTPVVATDVGAVREIVDHGRTGFVVLPHDAEAIAEAVQAILRMPPEQVRNMVEEGRKTVEGKFSVGTIAQQQRRIYERLGGGVGSSGADGKSRPRLGNPAYRESPPTG